MGDLGRSSIHADEHVHPVVILPQLSDLHPIQVTWLAQGAQDVFAKDGVQLLTVLFLLIRVLLTFLFRWHRFFQSRCPWSLAKKQHAHLWGVLVFVVSFTLSMAVLVFVLTKLPATHYCNQHGNW
ncbi:MAG: hypothetical protein HY000_28315 [Planctomycetes bacterium]|nr:hypothetical protein [Planctomycetota bacterium]